VAATIWQRPSRLASKQASKTCWKSILRACGLAPDFWSLFEHFPAVSFVSTLPPVPLLAQVSTAGHVPIHPALAASTLTTGQQQRVGEHDDAIRCIVHYQPLGMVHHQGNAGRPAVPLAVRLTDRAFPRPAGLTVTGSWDKTIRLWDIRAPGAIGVHSQPDKVFAMDATGSNLVVGTVRSGHLDPIFL
jgi:hypothetical protein